MKPTIVVNYMSELPESDKYVLLEWSIHAVHHRATAWSYLHRRDGGTVVTLDGQSYSSTLQVDD